MKRFILCTFFLFFAIGCSKKSVRTEAPVSNIVPTSSVQQRIFTHRFPKLANQLQVCCGERARMVLNDLHYYDLVVVEADLVSNLPQYLGPKGILRTRNPNLIILTYFSGADVNPYYLQPIQQEFVHSMQPSWYLRDINGKEVPFFQLSNSKWTVAQNPSSGVNAFLPKYLNDKILRLGLVDGIFYDWAITYVSWINSRTNVSVAKIDIDNDGKKDSKEKIDDKWTKGFLTMLKNSRSIFPQDTLVLGNGGWNTGPLYSDVLNGIMIEQFTQGEGTDSDLFGWRAVMRTYAYYLKKCPEPRVSFVMANDDNARNFKLMRFALSSALMFDGYFCFTNTNGIGPYAENRWYDEYSVNLITGQSDKNPEFKGYLGAPLGRAYDVNDPDETLEKAVEYRGGHAQDRVWRRDFENGIVLVNPGKRIEKIELQGTYRKIQGKYDPVFNDGTTLNTISLPGREGAILLKSVHEQHP